jgi:DNA-binding transcriptional MerR regulator
LSPSKNKAGNRTYRQKDIDTIHRIKDLLYRQKFTIEGARRILSNVDTPEIKTIEKQPQYTSEANVEILIKIRGELKSILENINS